MEDENRETLKMLETRVEEAVGVLNSLVKNLGTLNEHLDDLKNIVAAILGFKIKRG